MKYFVFAVAACGVPPLAVLLMLNKRWLKYVIWAMIAALAVYQGTAINFFSFEQYRGSSRGMEISVVYLFAMALILTSCLKFRFPGFAPSIGCKIYILFFLLCLPSWSTAAEKIFCWMETWKMIMLYIVYISIRGYLKMVEDAKPLVQALACFAIYNFLLVVKDHFSGVYQPEGAFPHQNCLAMAMHLFANMFFARVLSGGWRRSRLSYAAFIAASATIVRTYSRGALAMMPLSFFVTFLLVFLSTPSGAKSSVFKRALPIAVAGLIGLGVMLPRIIERFESAPEASKNTRIELAMCAREMIFDEPWRGVGLNNWGIKINPPYEYAERAGRVVNRGEEFRDGIVETVYLLVGAECGIPALAAMIIWFLSYLILCLILVKKLAGTPHAAIPAGLAGGFIACYLQSCLEWVLRQQMNLILLMVFYALLDYLMADAKRLKAEALKGGSKNV